MRLFYFILLFSVAGCAIKETVTEPIISFSTETFKQTSLNCNDTTGCASYEVVYPRFSHLDSATATILQQKIEAIVSLGNPEASGQTMQQVADSFTKGFESFQVEMPESASWYYHANVDVEILLDTLITLMVTEDYFTGGAHGGNGTYFINFLPRTKNELTLEQFLKPGFKRALTIAGEKQFRKVHEISDASGLSENGFEFPDDEFQLNSNYGFTLEGIMFVYNAYEIAPYVLGPTRILIPYQEIKEWLR